MKKPQQQRHNNIPRRKRSIPPPASLPLSYVSSPKTRPVREMLPPFLFLRNAKLGDQGYSLSAPPSPPSILTVLII